MHRPAFLRLAQPLALGVTFGLASCGSNDSPPADDSGGGAASVGGNAGGASAITAGTSAGTTPRGGMGSGGSVSTAGHSGGGTSGSGQAGMNGGTSAGGHAAGSGGAGGNHAAGSGSGGGTPASCDGPALSGGMQQCSSNASGKAGGYTWTIWSSGSGGCITPYGTGAAFKATWNNSGDFLARAGLQWDETKTYEQYGTISADFAYTKSGTGGGFSFIGIYGWSNNPLVEYYIVDDWYGAGPPTGGGTKKGSLDVDGGTYDIYSHTQTNQPSIHGNQTFPQFFSVRRTARQCGHISISEHFKKWTSLGMNLGKMYEAKILVEVGGGSGSIDFKSASITTQ